jgi:16S rRNA (cytosine967-C5)-methyltransferase
VADIWREALASEPPAEVAAGPYMRLSPLRHGTDGFFAATLVRKAAEPKAAKAGEPAEMKTAEPVEEKAAEEEAA